MNIRDINRPFLVRASRGKVALEKVRDLVMGSLIVLFRLTTGDGLYIQKLHVAVNGLLG